MRPALLLALTLLLPVIGASQEIEPQLAEVAGAIRGDQRLDVIIQFRDRLAAADISRPGANAVDRQRELISRLLSHAGLSQALLLGLLQTLGAQNTRELWMLNAVATRIRARDLARLVVLPGIELIKLDGAITLPGAVFAGSSPPEWNLATIRAVPLWNIGVQGNGVVVASLDTGVDVNHPDLSSRWRGGSNSWFDAHAQYASPYDATGHGTQTMGIMVGGDVGGTHIGVAPGAQWIAAKIFDDAGSAPFSAIHLAFQWMLDPDGDPNTDDAPDVVNNSWGFGQNSGLCITEFEADVDVLKLADIAVVFAAGNGGPAAGTDLSPANNVSGYAVGSVNSAENVVLGSSRGPSSCDGFTFPHLVAPGQSVRSSDLSFGGFPFFATVGGTSFAAPHVSGVMALLVEATGAVDPAVLEGYLIQGAVDLGPAGPDNNYGYGRLDAVGAYENAVGPLCQGGGYADSDGDGVNDICDNCIDRPNATQFDADNDGYGNWCDGDFNNNGVVDFGDVAVFRDALGTTSPLADFNGNGVVDFGDAAQFKTMLGKSPGPSALVP